MNFAEVEKKVAKLRQDLAAGRLTEEQFKARLRELMVEDEQGNWWMVGYETGEWYRHDGADWVPDQPPGRIAPKPVPPPLARPVARRRIPVWVWGVVGAVMVALALVVGLSKWIGGGVTPAPPTAPSLGDTWTRPTDGMVMVYVPAGEFEMGSDDDDVDHALQLCNEYYDDCEREWFEDEQPAHTVALDSFWIDQTEVTNGQYERCVEAGACDPPQESGSWMRDSYYGNSSYDDYPVIYVSWLQADAYCEWAEARLPTEAEWEYAARGPEGQVFLWGDEFDGTRLNYCDANCGADHADKRVDDGYADTAPVGSYLGGASWCDAQDLAGNVWEWVADWKGDYPSGRQVNPTGPSSGDYRVLRGGSWLFAADYARSAYRFGFFPGGAYGDIGFRCARGSE